MVALHDSSTPTLALNTPDDLGSAIAAAMVTSLWVNCENIVGADVLHIRVLLDSDLVDDYVITGQTRGPVKWFRTAPVETDGGLSLVYQLEQTAGTGRAVAWRILQIDA